MNHFEAIETLCGIFDALTKLREHGHIDYGQQGIIHTEITNVISGKEDNPGPEKLENYTKAQLLDIAQSAKKELFDLQQSLCVDANNDGLEYSQAARQTENEINILNEME